MGKEKHFREQMWNNVSSLNKEGISNKLLIKRTLLTSWNLLLFASFRVQFHEVLHHFYEEAIFVHQIALSAFVAFKRRQTAKRKEKRTTTGEKKKKDTLVDAYTPLRKWAVIELVT